MDQIVEIGRITHYYPKISVAVVELKAPLRVGDRIQIKGITTDFEQIAESMQIEHKNVQLAEAGKSVGLKVSKKVSENDIVHTIQTT